MAIERQTHPYEYLTRFNPDGTVRGQHIKYLTRIVDTETGEVFAEQEGDAIPVGDQRGGVILETALGEVAAALSRATEVEQQARQAAEQARGVAEQQRDAVTAERDAVTVERDQARQRVTDLEAELERTRTART